MSYILDALKKLEHEKSKKSRGTGIINISGALFENERQRPARSAGWKIVLAVVLAVVVTFAATWQFLQPGKSRRSKLRHNVVPVAPAPIPNKAAPVPPVPVPAPQGVLAQNMPAKVQAVVRPASPHPVQPQAPQVPVPAVAPDEESDSLPTRQALRKRLKDRKGQTTLAAPVISAPADIKLSGIAYQDERRARRAVVNGFLMQEGGTVSGAVITDIYQDRVRFSSPGGSFELSLPSSGAPATGK